MTVERLEVLNLDPWLAPFGGVIESRHKTYLEWMDRIEKHGNGVENFTKGYEYYGFNVEKDRIVYREWAPGAKEAYLIGDFNQWNRTSHPMSRDKYGVWSIILPNLEDGNTAIKHNTKVKISMVLPSGERIERVPAWITRAVQDKSVSNLFEGVFWNPPTPYQWKNSKPVLKKGLKVYESHIGICTPEGRVASYYDFEVKVLPRIHKLGYNCIQLMAIMEHAYYASFGYQVTNFFAASSRYGTPEQLKSLIDAAHGYGILVLLDVVHSHACKNVLDGLNMFDGTDHCYFHEGGRGRHELWDSRLFNYGHWEVLRFLLSNLRFYLEEYQFDGFRFDGVTSMMYLHHGIAYGFSGDYREYFADTVDNEALNYLILANDICHKLYPNLITIAEDVSGMPTLCRPVKEGGIGFDYRLGMALPDMWIKTLKEIKDEDWDMNFIAHTLTNRRHLEKTIAYCESHDQALVGDKTIAFWLMDKEMYDFMSTLTPLTPIIERGIALHKMIRLLTFGLGGEGYLNFMGNEFGHPEWLDFPREGNGDSYHYCRRQYNLVDDELLRYKFLFRFDEGMIQLDNKYDILDSPQAYISLKHESDKMMVFERSGLLFIFNFHSHKSYVDYKVGIQIPGVYKLVLSTDDHVFGGQDRVSHASEYHSSPGWWCNRENSLQVYIPCRTAIVLARQ